MGDNIDLIELFKQQNKIDKNFIAIAKRDWIVNKYSKDNFDKKMLESLTNNNLIDIINKRLDKKLEDSINKLNRN